MKKIAYVLLFTLTVFISCKKEKNTPELETVVVQLTYPVGSSFTPTAGVDVKLTGKTASFDAKTDATGKATFNVPVDIYDISVSDKRQDPVNTFLSYVFNGLKNGVTVTNSWSATDVISIDLEQAQVSQVIIKELFVGGTPKDDGSGPFAFDKYLVLYNNSSTIANLNNMCIGMLSPYNAHATNGYFVNGVLTYESENWVPAVQGFWYFQQNIALQPGQQIVIALNNAVNNKLTHTKSINFDNAAYYATYDIQKFPMASYYPTPAASIPTSHYLKAEKYGSGNAWSISVNSPALIIFDVKGTTPSAFAADASLTDILSAAYTSKKVPVNWVVDGVEAYEMNNTNSKKRLVKSIDVGFINHINNQGYSIYRNVDEEATKAVSGNTDKLVYNYNFGTVAAGGTTDPSGIDAEASIKKGARIIYKDTNNSTADFHLRSQASLRN